MEYLDFDLDIDRTGEGYTAKVKSPGGEGTATFAPPFSAEELADFWKHVDGVVQIGAGGDALTREFGGRLFESVFTGQVRTCFAVSLAEAEQRNGAGVRIRLNLTDAPEAARLPWEYLYWEERNRYLAQGAQTPIVRYLDRADPPRSLSVVLPLRVLVMISAPEGLPPLQVEHEWTLISDALTSRRVRGRVAVDRVPGTLHDLRQALQSKDYHVFHFIGHGGYDPAADDGVLFMETSSGQQQPVTATDLGRLLWNEPTMRLAVLNACEGARGSAGKPYAGLAQGLVQQGVPAVVAMQSSIPDDAAVLFATELYGALVSGAAVDTALSDARLAICGVGDRLEWGIPVLFMRSHDGRLFGITRRPVLQPVHAVLVLVALLIGLVAGMWISARGRDEPFRYSLSRSKALDDSLNDVIINGNGAYLNLAKAFSGGSADTASTQVDSFYARPELDRVRKDARLPKTHDLMDRHLDSAYVRADGSTAIAFTMELWVQTRTDSTGHADTIRSNQIVELDRDSTAPHGWKMSHVRFRDAPGRQ